MANAVTIFGNASDNQGTPQPVEGMTFVMKFEEEVTVDTTVTDENGDYTLSKANPADGDYRAVPAALPPHYNTTPPAGPNHAYTAPGSPSHNDDFTLIPFSNNSPTRETIGNQSWEEDSGTQTVTKNMSDADAGDVLDVVKVSGASWISYVKISATQYRLSVNTNDPAATPNTYPTSYKIVDNFGGETSTESLDVVITTANGPPVLTNPGTKNYQNNSGVKSFALSAVDPESDPITFSKRTPTAFWITVNIPTPGNVRVDTDAASRGAQGSRYRAADDHGNWDDELHTINILNNAPVLTNPGTPTFGQNTGIQTFQLVATDDDNDTLAYAKIAGESWATVNPSNGLVSVDTDSLAPGSYSHTWEVDDGQGGTDQETHDIDITSTNQPPVLTPPGNKVYEEDTGIQQFTLVATDPNMDPITYSKQVGPAFATVDPNTGVVDVDTAHASATVGVHNFTWRATDGLLNDDEAHTIEITAAPNQPPAFTNPGAKAYQDATGSYNFNLEAVDPEADPITFSKISGPAFGSTTGGGLVTMDTDDASSTVGLHTFVWEADDGQGNTPQVAHDVEITSGVPGDPNIDIGPYYSTM
jgi:hypothetical protein